MSQSPTPSEDAWIEPWRLLLGAFMLVAITFAVTLLSVTIARSAPQRPVSALPPAVARSGPGAQWHAPPAAWAAYPVPDGAAGTVPQPNRFHPIEPPAESRPPMPPWRPGPALRMELSGNLLVVLRGPEFLRYTVPGLRLLSRDPDSAEDPLPTPGRISNPVWRSSQPPPELPAPGKPSPR